MWRSRNNLDQNYGSISPIRGDELRYQVFLEQDPHANFIEILSPDELDVQEHIRSRLMTLLVMAIAAFTITALIVTLLVLLYMEPASVAYKST